MKNYQIKIKNGKIISIKYFIKNKKISFIQINGDFFFYPEEKLKDIENSLIGKDKKKSLEFLSNFFKKNKIKILGFDKSDFKTAIKNIFENEMASYN